MRRIPAEGTVSIDGLDNRHDSSPATYLVIRNGVSNVIHEFRHGLGLLVASHGAHVLVAVKWTSELGFDSFQGTRMD